MDTIITRYKNNWNYYRSLRVGSKMWWWGTFLLAVDALCVFSIGMFIINLLGVFS